MRPLYDQLSVLSDSALGARDVRTWLDEYKEAEDADEPLNADAFAELRRKLLGALLQSHREAHQQLAEKYGAYEELAALCDAESDDTLLQRYLTEFGEPFRSVAFRRFAQTPKSRVKLLQQVKKIIISNNSFDQPTI